jgi:hypothetical protein
MSVTLAAHAASGCGSDDTSSSGGTGGFGGFGTGAIPGVGGVVGTGGAVGNGGSPTTGGTFGSGGVASGGVAAGGGPGSGGDGGFGGPDASAGGSGNPDASTGGGGGTPPVGDGGCKPPDNLLDVSGLPDCALSTLPLCTNGRGKCFAKSIASQTVSAEALAQLADCDADNKCIPANFIATLGKFNAKTCASLKGAEGRCLSVCVPQVAGQASFLPKDVCADGELCAPCYDPRTGADTSACEQGCDTGPKQPPVKFDKCCGTRGSCVPKTAVPASDQTQLGKDTCTDANDLCAPDTLSQPGYKPKACTSIASAEGRCLPDCIPQVASQASRLKKDVCETGELCAPCYDPISGTDTGACTRNGDVPTKPKVTFPACCSSLGHCVPTDVLSSDQKGLLGADSCTTGNLCAPDVFSVAGQLPQSCRSLDSLNAEGRCVPSCVPSVQSQKDRLTQGTCPASTLCAPCFDPLTGANTGACSQNGDAPKETKKTFAACCGGDGACIPKPIVPASQQAQLGKDTCTGADNLLCAPKAFTDASVKPVACTAPGNVEARCLPACLPALQANKANLRQGTCKAAELCAPCFNPLDGTDTGACSINGDAPTKPKVVYPGCCPYQSNDRGTCVPGALLSTAQNTQLPQDSCATGTLCAPNIKVKDQTAKFPTCHVPAFSFACPLNQAATGCNGACVPSCIAGDLSTFLAQGTCGGGELCAPCINPTDNTRTGACD